MVRNLLYFWRIHLAVTLGAAVAAAVLTGALLVGDSVRGSLRDLTLERLGRIDDGLITKQFFRESLATGLQSDPLFEVHFSTVHPAIVANGNVTLAGRKTRSSGINIYGITRQFEELFSAADQDTGFGLADNLTRRPQQTFPSVIINRALQKELRASVGDQLILSFEQKSDIHRESLFGSKKTSDIIRALRLTLTRVVPDRGVGRFGIHPHQHLPLNAFVHLPVLQRAFRQEGRVNALFVARKNHHELPDAPGYFQKILQRNYRLADIGLKLSATQDYTVMESREYILLPEIIATAEAVLDSLNAPYMKILTYLANRMTHHGNMVPYSTVAALNTPVREPFGSLLLADGTPAPELDNDQLLVNQWVANDLQDLGAGDSIHLSYYSVGPADELLTETHSFSVAGIVKMQGLAADPSLTPEYPGIHDADNIYDWDPPFPVDLDLIRPKDEDYWDHYRGTPKAFVNLETGQRLWRSRFGDLTGLRIAAAPQMSLQAATKRFEERLLNKLNPAALGFRFQPLKEQGLNASSGATDFSMLFVGFSLFLIISAALLIGLMFRLGVEQRAGEIGLLLSTGYPLRRIHRQFFTEALLLAGVGCLLGLLGAVTYARLMITGLKTLWIGATGTGFLFLHLSSASLVIGYIISLLVVLISIRLTLRQLGKLPTPALLAGVTSLERRGAGRIARILGIASASAALLLTAFAIIAGISSSAGLFFAVGALLLISGLSFTAAWFKQGRHGRHLTGRPQNLWILGIRNNARKPGRSMLATALVACAVFMIVSVGANRQDFEESVIQKTSGVGGYTLMAVSDIPLLQNLNTTAGKFDLGFTDAESKALDSATIYPFRLLPGEDASCLNLYQPHKPRILGVPGEQIERGGFRFQEMLEEAPENPWQLLQKPLEQGVIPAIADYNSAMWILHVKLGEELVLLNENGREIRLRLVGLLNKSIFQSEVLISEDQFMKHFPQQSGYRYFLIDAPVTRSPELSQILENILSDYGFDVTTTLQKLAEYQAVENTYLSVFQLLGGLGLLLGTLGLGIVLFRNVLERRGEFAILRACGFRRPALAKLLLIENGFLIVLGMVIGSISALIAVLPHVLSSVTQIPWLSLSLTLLVVLITGMAASAMAVSAAMRIPLLPALKAE